MTIPQRGRGARCARHGVSLSFSVRAPIARFPRGRRSGRVSISASSIPAGGPRGPAHSFDALGPPGSHRPAAGPDSRTGAPPTVDPQIQRLPSHIRADHESYGMD
ncbi:hypothetical protein KRMM14A1004_04750 [Krasilnikovia sp. MM14-A1004]